LLRVLPYGTVKEAILQAQDFLECQK
jgi:hypothetical protein